MLVNGQWQEDWQPVQATDRQGGFVRQTSSFRHWVTPDGAPGPTGEGGFKAEPGRYHLYVALICPWASRTLIARQLKGLQDVISVSVVEPRLLNQGWHFGDYPGSDRDTLNGVEWLHELYTRADPQFTGRATVPVLWDKQTGRLVNNESADILRMLDSAFAAWADPAISLYPADLADLAAGIDTLNAQVYQQLNNGVYRAGFATTQVSYEQAVAEVFAMLEALEQRLSDGRPYLFGERLTEADVRLFVTLIRFDAAYHGLFKCNLRRVADYPALLAYTRRILALPGVRATVNMDHIKQGYYSIQRLNPVGLVPVGPDLAVYGW